MVVRLGAARLLAATAIFAITLSFRTAEAGFLDGIMNGLMKNVQDMVKKTVEDTTKHFDSVLSGMSVFGEGAKRSDFKFVEIIEKGFSRKNGIPVGRSDSDTDWKIDGNKAIGAIIAKGGGGGVSISVSGNKVTIKRGSDASAKRDDKDDKKGDKKDDKKGEMKDDEPKKSTEPDVDVNPVEALDLLIEDWGAFMKSEIWYAQDEAAKTENTDKNNSNDGIAENRENKDDSITGRGSRVVNGLFFAEALASGSRFAVKFFYDDEENFYCSGSLIGYPYVLTAAHCGLVAGDNARVGGRLLRSGYKATIAEVFMHPDFDRKTLANDVAIVRLDGLETKEVLEKNMVEAARVNKRKKYPKEDSKLLLSGHGSTQRDGSGFSNELMTTRQTVHKDKKCAKEITQGELKDDGSFLCAGDGERSTSCVGDSGGGLWRYVVRKKDGKVTAKYFEIVGVVSFGEITDESLCPRGPPTVYQEVSHHHEWIVNVVGKDNLA